MKLGTLMEGVAVSLVRGTPELEVSSIAYDSRKVKPGGLFVAIKGRQFDGHQFIPQALSRGAKAIVVETQTLNIPSNFDVAILRTFDSRQALAQLAARFWGNPSAGLILIGITGTNGKTTTAYLVESVLQEAGYVPGVIGTVSYRYRGQVFPALQTTPESLDLHYLLRQMLDVGVDCAILEVSSHAIALKRIAECRFKIGVFTSFSQDHLDFHGTMEEYWQMKEKFFRDYIWPVDSSISVVNGDELKGKELVQKGPDSMIVYGLEEAAMVKAQNLKISLEGIHSEIYTPQGLLEIRSRLVGDFNIHNILAAVAVGVALEIPPSSIQRGIANVQGIPGRMESIENNRGIHIFVDFAHTPDALTRVLRFLNREARGRIITLFGCGGDRDRGKRPLMGQVAAKYSDLIVLTSDNPRSEDPLAILADIEKGLEGCAYSKVDSNQVLTSVTKKLYTVVADRREAIRVALSWSQPGDVLLLAGKGHESYQIIGNERIPFDDRQEVRQALTETKSLS